MFYHARYYSHYLNRFIQPDSIVPDPKNPQSLNRYSYGLNNPVKYTDPSGHFTCDGAKNCHEIIEQWLKLLSEGGEVSKSIANFFNLKDSPTMFVSGMMGMYTSIQLRDQIHIHITSEAGGFMQAGPDLGNNILISSAAWQDVQDGADPRYSAGAFAHEINHLREDLLTGTVEEEVRSFDLQNKIWTELGYKFGYNVGGKFSDANRNLLVRAVIDAHGVTAASDYYKAVADFGQKYPYADMPVSFGDKLIRNLQANLNNIWCFLSSCGSSGTSPK